MHAFHLTYTGCGVDDVTILTTFENQIVNRPRIAAAGDVPCFNYRHIHSHAYIFRECEGRGRRDLELRGRGNICFFYMNEQRDLLNIKKYNDIRRILKLTRVQFVNYQMQYV
jgi:hypothetical protein